jgi:hypothetical protein
MFRNGKRIRPRKTPMPASLLGVAARPVVVAHAGLFVVAAVRGTATVMRRYQIVNTLYSARSVPSGSRVAARHAGRALAATPINSSRAPALKYVNGSLLLTP